MKRLFQFAFLSAAAVALVSGMASCSKGGDDTQLSEYLKIVPDKTVIMSDGFDAATLSVEYDGVDVTGKAVIFNSDGTEAALQDSRFTTETSGTYSFYATYNGERSHEVTITAIDSALPEIPEDPQPESTDFVRKVLLLQFTGTACGNCPYVMAALDRLSTSPVREDYVRVACHSYNGDDPAYYSGPLARSQDVPGYPHLTLDLDKNLFVQSNANSDVVYATCAGFIQDELEDRPASAGIAACAAVSGENVIVSMSVKAAKAVSRQQRGNHGEDHLGNDIGIGVDHRADNVDVAAVVVQSVNIALNGGVFRKNSNAGKDFVIGFKRCANHPQQRINHHKAHRD